MPGMFKKLLARVTVDERHFAWPASDCVGANARVDERAEIIAAAANSRRRDATMVE